MSDRSTLLEKILTIWDYSEEGRRYLDWLLASEAKDLDGGAVLREAVLDLIENDLQLRQLRRTKQESGLEEFYAQLSPEDAAVLRTHTKRLNKMRALQEDGLRGIARTTRAIRRLLRWDRLETLRMLDDAFKGSPPDEVANLFAKMENAREVAAKLASQHRTSPEKLDIAAEWKAQSTEDPWLQTIQNIADDPGEEGFDNRQENFDRYYSRQIVAKLDEIVERMTPLGIVNLNVGDKIVSRLFREAHEAYLYGFDSACISLCRSLMEHSLQDKLSTSSTEKLHALIQRAVGQGLLDTQSEKSARSVKKAGDKIMHDIRNLQSTAQEVLGDTRIVLIKLYA